MPGLIVPTRRSREPDDGDVTDDSRNGAATPSSFASRGSKRTRLNNDVESESEDDVLPNSYRAQPRPPRPTVNGNGSANGANGASVGEVQRFQPGSIVRVKLTNFVTYTSAEFNLGPSMNMVIGPNGTGKSTLVCAICLGLGWGPNHLGRAKETGEFVKHGAREAEIEIELAAGRGMARNPIVRRVLKREGNKNSYFLDGRPVPAKEIKEYAQKFDIQIDNLCSFLPQDRVVEFAGLSPVQLLEQTQQAAGGPHMQEWHAELKELGRGQRDRQHEERRAREELGEKVARQKASEADVQRVQERSDLTTKIEAWELYRPFIRYRSAKNRYETADMRKKEAEKELAQLREDVQPALQAVQAKQEYAVQVDRVVKQRQRLLARQENTAQDKKMKHDNMAQAIEDKRVEREAEINGSKRRNQEMKRTEQIIQRLKVQMANEEIEFDAADYNSRIREKDQRIRQLTDQVQELSSNTERFRQQATVHRETIARVGKERDELSTQVGQQMVKLRNKSRDTAKAWEWVQQHQGEFREEIFGPPAIVCSVKNPRYTDAIESMLQMGDLLAFTCTNHDDYHKLINSLCGRSGLNLSDVTIRLSTKPFNSWQKSLPEHELTRLGLDSYLVDQLDGPDSVLSMLCDSRGLHKTAVSLQAHNPAQYHAMTRSPITSWVAGRQSYNITRRREYGEGATSTITRQLRQATMFSSQTVGTEEEGNLAQQDREAREALEELKSQNEELKKEIQTLREEAATLRADKKELEDEKAERQRAVADFRALPSKLEANQARLDDFEQERKTTRANVERISTEMDKLVLDKAQAALEYAGAVELLRRLHADVLEAELWYIEAKSEHEALDQESAAVQQLLEERQREVKELTVTSRSAKKEALSLRDTAVNISENLSPEQQAVHKEICEEDNIRRQAGEEPYSIQDLDADIASARNQLDLLTEGHPNLMRDYERREKQIEELKEKLRSLESGMQEQAQRIAELRAQWEPELDNLVGKISDAFSYNFTKIGCAGQVEVYKDEEDFEAWSIRIQVKFRENEPLSILNSHRQSGGERAVSTIFYLMALQSLSRAPFRVVDEINQGMDPRNERVVHERMVDIACEEATSQYFLVTPKLLTGLKYHERMTVHIIESGEYMPSDHRELDIGRVLELQRRVKAAA